MNSWTDTSIDPVGPCDRSGRGKVRWRKRRETDTAFGMVWSRSDAPLNQDDRFGWGGRQGGEAVAIGVVTVDNELGGSIRILEGKEREGL